MLGWRESSAAARLVQETLWGYPIILSSHAVGMAVLAGIVLMLNFRVLGLAPAVPVSALRPIYRVALIGLVINVISGVMLFVANPDAFLVSKPFWIKITLLVVGITLMVKMSGRLFRPGSGDVVIDASARTMAKFSTFAWFGVIIMGRLIAYWDFKEF